MSSSLLFSPLARSLELCRRRGEGGAGEGEFVRCDVVDGGRRLCWGGVWYVAGAGEEKVVVSGSWVCVCDCEEGMMRVLPVRSDDVGGNTGAGGELPRSTVVAWELRRASLWCVMLASVLALPRSRRSESIVGSGGDEGICGEGWLKGRFDEGRGQGRGREASSCVACCVCVTLEEGECLMWRGVVLAA